MISGGSPTPNRKPSRASGVSEQRRGGGPDALPAELEARIAALESASCVEDFDRRSWMWMALFGVVLPLALIFLGR
jgi:hypothetical protein